MRCLVSIIAAVALVGVTQTAIAQQSDYSGRWLLSGLLLSGRGAMSFAQICDLKQDGTQIAGPCHGPNGSCSAVGVVTDAQVDLTCRTTATSNPALAGVLTFHGELDSAGTARGSCSQSRMPGVEGKASMMRL